MSAYTDSVNAYAQAKAHSTSSSASVISDISYTKPSKAPTSSGRKSKSSSLKNWTKQLITDIGNPPTYRYDQLNDKSAASPSSKGLSNYGTNALGAPFLDSRPIRRL